MLTVTGDKFVIARWIPDMYLQDYMSWMKDFDDESVVKSSEIAVLRSTDEINKLGTKIMEELRELYREMGDPDEPDMFEPIVWSWHVPDPQSRPVPDRMVLFRGEEEVCSVWFEQVEPL